MASRRSSYPRERNTNDPLTLFIYFVFILIIIYILFKAFNTNDESNKKSNDDSNKKLTIDEIDEIEKKIKEMANKLIYPELLLYASALAYNNNKEYDKSQIKDLVNKYYKHFILFHKKSIKILDCNGKELYFNDNEYFLKYLSGLHSITKQENGSNIAINFINKGDTIIKKNPYIVWTRLNNNIQHYQSKKCLDSNGNDLYLSLCQESNPYQSWELPQLGFNYLIHKQSNKCLDGNGNKVYMSNLDPKNDYKMWVIKDDNENYIF